MTRDLERAYQPKIEQTVLDNGLTVVTEAMPGRRIASVGVWSPAGSAREPRPEAGIAHLLEHMLFKGTKRRSAFEIAAAIDVVGGDLNAFTDREHSCVYCTLLGEYIPRAVDVLTDMLFHSSVPERELAVERTVVLGEIADYEDSAEDVVHDEAVRLLWPTHPLGRPVHGSARTVNALTHDHLLAYLNKWYAPGALVVAAAGDVCHAQLVDLVQKAAPNGSRPRPVVRARVPKVGSGSRILPRDTEQAHLCMAVPAAGWRESTRYVDSVIASALGTAPSSRLFQQVRERRGLAYNVGSFFMPCEKTGVIALYAGTMPEKVRQVAGLFEREAASLAAKGLKAAELKRVRGYMLANIGMSMDSPVSEARRLGHSVLHRGCVVEPTEAIDGLNAVTLDDIRTRARELFGEGFPTSAFAGPLDDNGEPCEKSS